MTDPKPHSTDSAADGGARRAHALPALSLLLAVLIAAVLQFAAAAKVAAGADDLRRIKDSAALVESGLPATVSEKDFEFLLPPGDLFERGILLDFGVAGAEFALVVLVLAAHRTRAVWLLVPLVFATFAGYGAQRLVNGLPCGCFGDLWHPPDGLTIALDVVFVIAALGLAAIRGTSAKALGVTLLLALGGAAGGYVFAAIADAPKPGERSAATTIDGTGDGASTESDGSAPERLLASDLMAEQRDTQRATGEPIAYYVFIWDPTCTICERLMPVVEHYQQQLADEGSPFLQVILFKKQDIRDQLGIQSHEWGTSPVVFLVQDGRVVPLPGGDEAPLPDEVLARLTAGEPVGAE